MGKKKQKVTMRRQRSQLTDLLTIEVW